MGRVPMADGPGSGWQGVLLTEQRGCRGNDTLRAIDVAWRSDSAVLGDRVTRRRLVLLTFGPVDVLVFRFAQDPGVFLDAPMVMRGVTQRSFGLCLPSAPKKAPRSPGLAVIPSEGGYQWDVAGVLDSLLPWTAVVHLELDPDLWMFEGGGAEGRSPVEDSLEAILGGNIRAPEGQKLRILPLLSLEPSSPIVLLVQAESLKALHDVARWVRSVRATGGQRCFSRSSTTVGIAALRKDDPLVPDP